MRSAIHATFGKPSDVLEIAESPLPEPGPGEVRIKMRLAAIHNHDLFTVAGTYGVKPSLPATGGSEAMGTVDALGAGVTHLALGQRVAASGLHGAWAEYFIARAASVVPLPETISDETGAQLISMPLSALVLLEFLGIQPGQWIIQNAANGAVAKVVAMIAKARGIPVVNIVRRSDSIAELAALGIAHVVASAEADWKDQVRAIVGPHPIVAAVDGVGGQPAGDLLSLLGENSQLVSFGAMSGEPLIVSGGDLIFKQAVVKGFWLGKIMQTTPPETIGRWFGELLALVSSGQIALQVGGIFDLADIAKAAEASNVAGRPGKILLRP